MLHIPCTLTYEYVCIYINIYAMAFVLSAWSMMRHLSPVANESSEGERTVCREMIRATHLRAAKWARLLISSLFLIHTFRFTAYPREQKPAIPNSSIHIVPRHRRIAFALVYFVLNLFSSLILFTLRRVILLLVAACVRRHGVSLVAS